MTGWIQPIVISLLVVAPEVLPALLALVLLAAPLMPELQASRKLPPPTTAAPTPAARNRLRRENPPANRLAAGGVRLCSLVSHGSGSLLYKCASMSRHLTTPLGDSV